MTMAAVLPQHRHLETTHRMDYQYPHDWTPKPEEVCWPKKIGIGHFFEQMV